MLTNLADIARRSGLPVVEVSGWKSRGRPGSFKPKGVLVHHTATSTKSSVSSVLNLLRVGRTDLQGPLCQIGLDRDGTVYIIAAGRANHAGKNKKVGGIAAGDGNSNFIGIEAFNSGYEGWSAKQLDAYHRLCAALCDGYGWSRSNVFGHGETSTTGKWDPGHNGKMINMNSFRESVKAVSLGNSSKPSNPNNNTMSEEDDEDMAKNSGFYYYSESNKVTYYMIVNTESGFLSEYNSSPGNVTPSSYNNPVAAAFGTGSYAKITEAHARRIKESLARVLERKIELDGSIEVNISGDEEAK